MSEIIYYYSGVPINPSTENDIRWLLRSDLQVFNEHLLLCRQKPITQKIWDSMYGDGTIYSVLFADNLPIARACVEKHTEEIWEVADVRVAKDYRNKGFACEISRFVTNYILRQGKTATIRTEEDNYQMQRVIMKLGFNMLNNTGII